MPHQRIASPTVLTSAELREDIGKTIRSALAGETFTVQHDNGAFTIGGNAGAFPYDPDDEN